MSTEDLSTLLQAVDTRSLVDKVEMNLIEFFIKKELQPGDSIPKEMELVNTMGVSRTVIRESLNRLKTMGIIESKKHKGTIIKSPDLSVLLQKSMIPHILDNSTLKDIFELRLVLEIGMGDLIFRRITPKDIEELEAIVDEEPEFSEDILFDISHEIKFHGKLYEITGNETLRNFQQILLPVFNYVYDSGLIHKPIENKRYISHKGIVDTLKNGSPDEFRMAMRKHLENHFQRIFTLEQHGKKDSVSTDSK
ncbi:FadR/GntR family transcriptional regulator [Sunxiuqinia elliptica]|uniref:DNA-binding FadR family transcriptional regulator n=1 Tax=Sunxiuqinia elliptica TaxID=655355 RepID=A0A1I2HXU6_9BACT|nr:FadR/GntR family transcriptional regulator [Sunxiuqinia elliptica]TDO05555.1 DNA-binding FadR family transcriptional regulator [Sunxiuqinia elliptica]TDO65099.1 DNA-binding FadR family transcriptional regulator [Sunxiuqinia elliptica]SFF34864.1 DNA-binding transcriptional regulator, FadR family [Sunxiuqinia elliptica]